MYKTGDVHKTDFIVGREKSRYVRAAEVCGTKSGNTKPVHHRCNKMSEDWGHENGLINQ